MKKYLLYIIPLVLLLLGVAATVSYPTLEENASYGYVTSPAPATTCDDSVCIANEGNVGYQGSWSVIMPLTELLKTYFIPATIASSLVVTAIIVVFRTKQSQDHKA